MPGALGLCVRFDRSRGLTVKHILDELERRREEARQGGGEPGSNPRLRLALDKALGAKA